MARSEPPAQLFQQCDNREFPHTYARAREGLRPKRPMRSCIEGSIAPRRVETATIV